ncbi:MAG TPA: hypothetical protein VHE30_13630 [Polyangiaceae bacterium]|nr:hypothetical protein [Polyangiaceae bacterium]
MASKASRERIQELRSAARDPALQTVLLRAFDTPEGQDALREAFDTDERRKELLAALDTPEGRDALRRAFDSPEGRKAIAASIAREIEARQPGFRDAVWMDAKIFSSLGMGPPRFDTRAGFLVELVRLSWKSDAFLALFLYRVRKLLAAHRVPLIPRFLHRASMALAQVSIGDGAVLEPGVYLPHGQVVIDGVVEVGSGTVIAPWVTIGRASEALEGPKIGKDVLIGTGAKLLGPLQVGLKAVVGANAVVVKDVAPYTTVGGVPARLITDRRDDPEFRRLRDAVKEKLRQDTAHAANGASPATDAKREGEP